MRRWLVSLILVCGTGSAGAANHTQPARTSSKPARAVAGTARRAYLLYCAGIMVGVSNERDVLRMYGAGLLAPGEGHGRGRYYVDPKQQVTLHVELGVDSLMERVEYSRGVRIPPSLRQGKRLPAAAISSKLTADERVDPWLVLGVTPQEVLRRWGPPTSRLLEGGKLMLRYTADETTMAYVLEYEARFVFENDRLVSVSLFNGE